MDGWMDSRGLIMLYTIAMCSFKSVLEFMRLFRGSVAPQHKQKDGFMIDLVMEPCFAFPPNGQVMNKNKY